MNKLDIESITNHRLWKYMCDNGIKDCKTFAYLLIDKNFYIFDNQGNKLADSTSDEYKRYYKNADTLSKTILRCLYHNEYKNDDLLIACCRFFNCSADYLLGFIDLPTHEKTDFNKLTGLWDNCIDTLAECNKHEAYDNSWADYNKNIILILNYLLYQGKDNLINRDKITLLNDIFNYLVFSDFYSYTDNNGNEQGSHVTFTDKNVLNLCSLPVAHMHNAIKLNINSVLDTLKQHMKKTGFYTLQKPTLESLLNEIKENQDKIDDYNNELQEILKGNSPQDREDYIGLLERCKGSCLERIYRIEQSIIVNHKEVLQKKDFSCFPDWQQSLFDKLYNENEYYITGKI